MNKTEIPQVVVETPSYQNAIEPLWSEHTQTDFKNYIACHPLAGDVIPGTGGIRKIRWQGSGRGKRGGVRVVYYFFDENHPIYLLYAYPKNVQDNLTSYEKKLLSDMARQLKSIFRKGARQ